MTLLPAAGPQTADAPPAAGPSHKNKLYLQLALLPLSAILVFVVLLAMASNSAAATGGCGGG